MKRLFTLIFLCILSFNAIHAKIIWELSDDGTLTILGTDMEDYEYNNKTAPWHSQYYKIKKVVIENGVTNIGKCAFWGCSELASVTIPQSVTSIGESAFCGCSSLSSVNIPNSVGWIGISAFKDCISLSSITIPNSVTDIAKEAFWGCTSLTSVCMSNSVTYIKERVFCGCSSLISVNIPNSVTTIDHRAFLGCSSLTSIEIPNSVTSIGGSAFEGCSSLTFVNIPNSVTTIYAYAFKKCSSLTSVYIPNTVNFIDKYAFENCKALSKLICSALTPPKADYTIFAGTPSDCILYVPASVINAYRVSDGWAREKEYIKAIIEPVSVSFANENVNMIIGTTKLLEATVAPEDAIDMPITWNSSDTAIVTVSSEGIVIAKSIGTSNITATTYNGKTAICTVNVLQPVTAIILNETSVALWVDETEKLTTTFIPMTASNTDVCWSSSNNNVATVSSKGVITAKGKGTCTITCTAADGYGTKSTCEVTVKQQVTGIALSETTTSLWVGKTRALTATVSPTTANITAVTWSSSDSNVATVNENGVVTCVGAGTAIIKATAADGKGAYAECKVVVVYNSVTFIDASEDYSNETEAMVKTLKYIRTFNNIKWQALYIPFSLSYDDWKDDFEVAYINGIRQYDKNDDGAIDETIMDVIKIKEGSLIPNTPYLIKAKSVGEKTFSLTDATLYPAEENSIDCRTTIAEYTFTGTYSTIPSATLIANQYYAMGGGELIISDGSNDLKPYRWYMKIDARSPMYNTSNAAKTITINVVGEESETTGICQLQMNNDKLPVCDLNGRRVSENSLKPGVYIKNGKKVIIK